MLSSSRTWRGSLAPLFPPAGPLSFALRSWNLRLVIGLASLEPCVRQPIAGLVELAAGIQQLQQPGAASGIEAPQPQQILVGARHRIFGERYDDSGEAPAAEQIERITPSPVDGDLAAQGRRAQRRL